MHVMKRSVIEMHVTNWLIIQVPVMRNNNSGTCDKEVNDSIPVMSCLSTEELTPSMERGLNTSVIVMYFTKDFDKA